MFHQSHKFVFCVLPQTTKHLWLAMLLCCGGDLSLFTPVIKTLGSATQFNMHGLPTTLYMQTLFSKEGLVGIMCVTTDYKASVVSYAPLLWW